jgi:hypothetical protein
MPRPVIVERCDTRPVGGANDRNPHAAVTCGVSRGKGKAGLIGIAVGKPFLACRNFRSRGFLG